VSAKDEDAEIDEDIADDVADSADETTGFADVTGDATGICDAADKADDVVLIARQLIWHTLTVFVQFAEQLFCSTCCTPCTS
jgi:hypothetical protein